MVSHHTALTCAQVTTVGRNRVEDLPAADGYEHINLAQAEAQERLVQKARALPLARRPLAQHNGVR
jgi:methanogenic corrinoid protein MtbC1